MDYTATFFLPVDTGRGTVREDGFGVTCEIEPFVPGYTSGPPEKCYPPEGGFASGYGEVKWTDTETGEESIVTWEDFVAIWAKANECTAEEAETEINRNLYELWEDDRRAAYDDEMDRRYQQKKEDGRW